MEHLGKGLVIINININQKGQRLRDNPYLNVPLMYMGYALSNDIFEVVHM